MTMSRSRRTFLRSVAAGGASIVAARPAGAAPQAAPRALPPPTGSQAGRPRRHAGAHHGLPELAGAGRPREAGDRLRARERQVGTRCRRTGEGLRDPVRHGDGHAALPGDGQRHVGAAHRARGHGHRRRRRGDRAALHLRRHGQRRAACCTRSPVFVDTDIETFQIDARKIDAAITDRTTRLILPVHLGGSRGRPGHDHGGRPPRGTSP